MIPNPSGVAPASAVTASVVTISRRARSMPARIASLSSGPPLMPKHAASKDTVDGSSLAASRGKTARNRALQLRPALGGGRMVARARLTRAEDTAGLIADHGCGAGLASVHSQEKFHGNR